MAANQFAHNEFVTVSLIPIQTTHQDDMVEQWQGCLDNGKTVGSVGEDRK